MAASPRASAKCLNVVRPYFSRLSGRPDRGPCRNNVALFGHVKPPERPHHDSSMSPNCQAKPARACQHQVVPEGRCRTRCGRERRDAWQSGSVLFPIGPQGTRVRGPASRGLSRSARRRSPKHIAPWAATRMHRFTLTAVYGLRGRLRWTAISATWWVIDFRTRSPRKVGRCGCPGQMTRVRP